MTPTLHVACPALPLRSPGRLPLPPTSQRPPYSLLSPAGPGLLPFPLRLLLLLCPPTPPLAPSLPVLEPDIPTHVELPPKDDHTRLPEHSFLC